MPIQIAVQSNENELKTHVGTLPVCQPNDWTLLVSLDEQPSLAVSKLDCIHTPRTLALLLPSQALDNEVSRGYAGRKAIIVRFQPKPEWLHWLRWPRMASGLMAVQVNNDEEWTILLDCVWRLRDHAIQPGPRNAALAMNLLERILIVADGSQSRTEENVDERVFAATQYVRNAVGRDVNIDRAAAAACLSASRLSHLFREHLGVTFSNYVQLERLRIAKQLLETSCFSTQGVARELGMEPTYFSAWFRRCSGQSPSQYRSVRPSKALAELDVKDSGPSVPMWSRAESEQEASGPPGQTHPQ